jgi:hypothetical protein
MSPGISMMRWQKSHMTSMKKEEGSMTGHGRLVQNGNDCEEKIRKKNRAGGRGCQTGRQKDSSEKTKPKNMK